jgi:hypothetical protein
LCPRCGVNFGITKFTHNKKSTAVESNVSLIDLPRRRPKKVDIPANTPEIAAVIRRIFPLRWVSSRKRSMTNCNNIEKIPKRRKSKAMRFIRQNFFLLAAIKLNIKREHAVMFPYR